MQKQVIALLTALAVATLADPARAASAASATSATSAADAQVSVTAPWVRATVPVQKSTGAFLQLKSRTDARLVGVSSPVAGSAELHEMRMEGDMMKMRQVDGVALPAGKDVALASGGYHIMLFQLKRQLQAGATVPLTLLIERKNGKREKIHVSAAVKPLGFSAAPGH